MLESFPSLYHWFSQQNLGTFRRSMQMQSRQFLNQIDSHGHNIYYYALRQHHPDYISLLVQGDIDINFRLPHSQQNILHLCLILKKYNHLSDLLYKHFHLKGIISTATLNGFATLPSCEFEKYSQVIDQKTQLSPLMLASYIGSLSTVKTLLDYGADPTLVNNEGKNTFFYALEAENSEVFAFLVNHLALTQSFDTKKAVLTQRDNLGDTVATLYASKGHHRPTLKCLLYEVSKLKERSFIMRAITDKLGLNILEVAASEANGFIFSDIQDFLENEPALSKRYIRHSYQRAFYLATLEQDLDLVSYLLDTRKVNVNQSLDIDGVDKTPLMLAAIANDADLCRQLITSGAEISKVNSQNMTAFDIAIEKGCYDAMSVIRSFVVDPSDSGHALLFSYPSGGTTGHTKLKSQHKS